MKWLMIFWASAAGAQCPPPPDHRAAITERYAQVQAAPDAATGQRIAQNLWAFWLEAPDARAQALLDQGMARREAWALSEAVNILTELVNYCPAYAEGYNQRAFALFLMGQYEVALDDLRRAETLSPRHTGVLTGQALALMELGRHDEAQAPLKRALALNPWLSERALLIKPKGDEI